MKISHYKKSLKFLLGIKRKRQENTGLLGQVINVFYLSPSVVGWRGFCFQKGKDTTDAGPFSCHWHKQEKAAVFSSFIPVIHRIFFFWGVEPTVIFPPFNTQNLLLKYCLWFPEITCLEKNFHWNCSTDRWGQLAVLSNIPHGFRKLHYINCTSNAFSSLSLWLHGLNPDIIAWFPNHDPKPYDLGNKFHKLFPNNLQLTPIGVLFTVLVSSI